MFGSSGKVSLGFLIMSSLAWAGAIHKDSGGMINGFTLLVDNTLIYS